MEDKSWIKKPLRTAASKLDIAKAYGKQGERNIPISDANEADKNLSENISDDTLADINVFLENEEEDLKKDKKEKTVEIDETIENNFVSKEEFDALMDQIEEYKQETEKYKDAFARKAAELENVIRRTAKEKQDMLQYANEKLLFSLLEFVDGFEAAIDSAKKTEDVQSIVTGLEMIYQKVMKTLDDNGVKKMEDPTGKEFDVNLHEAMMIMPSEYPEGIVAQTFQTGYMLYDKVLRHARVATSQG